MAAIRLADKYCSHIVVPECLSHQDRALWAEFCQATPGLATAFLSFSYVLAASRAFRDVRICVIEREGQAVAFFPFQFRSLGHRLLGFGERVGGELSDYFGLVAAAGVVLSPRRLMQLAGLNALLFTHLDDSQTQYGLTGSQPQTGLRIDLAQGGDAYWSALKRTDKRFFGDTERRERKLVEAHGPLRLVFRHQDPAAELARLIAGKREQYARTGASDALVDERARRFMQFLAESDDPLCRGTLSTLHAGDTWVASHFGLQHRGTLAFWFPVYNPDLQQYSPGRVLLTSIIKQADDLGVSCIDRGVGDSQAKRDFANAEHSFLRGLWHRRNLPATVVRAGLSLQWRLKVRSARCLVK